LRCTGNSRTIFAGPLLLAVRKTRKPFNLRFETKPLNTLQLHRLETPCHCFPRWRVMCVLDTCSRRTGREKIVRAFPTVQWHISWTKLGLTAQPQPHFVSWPLSSDPAVAMIPAYRKYTTPIYASIPRQPTGAVLSPSFRTFVQLTGHQLGKNSTPISDLGASYA